MKNTDSFHQQFLSTYYIQHTSLRTGFPGGTVVMIPPANAADEGLISGSRRSLGVGNGNPLQYSCLKNSMDRGAWQASYMCVCVCVCVCVCIYIYNCKLKLQFYIYIYIHTHTHYIYIVCSQIPTQSYGFAHSIALQWV